MARILLHTLVFAPDAVSTAYLMKNLAQRLSVLGHDVTVLTTTPHYNLDPAALREQSLQKRWGGLAYTSHYHGIPVWHVKIPMKGQRVWARAFDYLRFHFVALLIGLLFVRRQDVVISPSPPLTMGIIGWLLALRHWTPCVYNVQEIYPDFAVNQGLIRNRLFIHCLKILERSVYRRSSAIVTIADGFSRIIEQRGVDRTRVLTIPNFVDTDLYQPAPRDNPLAERLGLTDQFVVLYGGNLGLSQDWESLLYAAEQLADEPILFALAGGGARENWLKQQIALRKLSNVRLLGYFPERSMPELYGSADLVTIPMKSGTTRDTLPSKVFAIMACARPLLISADDDSDFKRIVLEAGCGRAVEPDDAAAFTLAVMEAYQQRHLLNQEGRAGWRYVQQGFTKEAVGDQYDQLVRRLTCQAV